MRNITTNRNYWRPSNGVKLELPKGLTEKDCEVWTYANKDKFCALGFRGRAVKPNFRYAFKNTKQRDDYILKFYLDVYKRKQQKEKRKNFTNKIKKGQIYYTSWGYDQTRHYFFIILESKGKTVKVQQIRKKIAKITAWDSKMVKPDKSRKEGKPFTRRVRYPGDNFLDDLGYNVCSLYQNQKLIDSGEH